MRKKTEKNNEAEVNRIAYRFMRTSAKVAHENLLHFDNVNKRQAFFCRLRTKQRIIKWHHRSFRSSRDRVESAEWTDGVLHRQSTFGLSVATRNGEEFFATEIGKPMFGWDASSCGQAINKCQKLTESADYEWNISHFSLLSFIPFLNCSEILDYQPTSQRNSNSSEREKQHSDVSTRVHWVKMLHLTPRTSMCVCARVLPRFAFVPLFSLCAEFVDCAQHSQNNGDMEIDEDERANERERRRVINWTAFFASRWFRSHEMNNHSARCSIATDN